MSSNPSGGNGASSSSSPLPRLGPTWRSSNSQGGKGFQPPPAVSSDPTSSRYSSSGSHDGTVSPNRNSFSALVDDEDSSNKPPERSNSGGFSSRSEGLRTAAPAGGSGGAYRSSSMGGGGGRSLAELASRVGSRSRSQGSSYDDSNRSNNPEEYKKIIRFTREKLLSLRPRPKGFIPSALKHLEGNLILSDEPQDPGRFYFCFVVN